MTDAEAPTTDPDLRGVLEDGDGRPVAGARLRAEGGAEETRSGPDGRFVLPRPACAAFVAILAADGGRDGRLPLPPDSAEGARLVLVPPDAIPVRVLTPASAPLPARYGWQAFRREGSGLVPGPSGTAASPRFAVRGLPPGAWALAVWAGPFLPVVVEPVTLDGRTSSALVTVEVSRRGASVAGRVVTPTGQPRAGVRVEVRPRDPTLRLPPLRAACASEAGGRWRLEGLPPGGYDLVADGGPGGPRLETALSLLDREERAMDLVVG